MKEIRYIILKKIIENFFKQSGFPFIMIKENQENPTIIFNQRTNFSKM